MHLDRWVIAAAIASALAVPAAGQVRHPSPSRDEQFLECAGRVLGGRVIRDGAVSRLSGVVPCPAPRGAFLASLAARNWKVSPAGNWLVIHPTVLVVNSDLRLPYKWDRLRIVPKIEQRRSTEGLPMTPGQVDRIARQAIETARPTPLNLGLDPNAGRDYEETFMVAVDRVRLRRNVDSIVVVLGVPPRARLLYGELRAATFVPLWDSPLLSWSGWASLGWSYVDLDADGELEVVFYGGQQPSYQTLVAFDLDGRELTRNGDCFIVDTALLDTNPTCPLVADRIVIEDLKPDERRARDIFIYLDDVRERFRLVNGVYVPFGRPPLR